MHPIKHWIITNEQSGKSSHSPLSILHLTIYHRRQCADKRCQNRRPNDPCWIHAAILLSIGNHIHRYQLQGRNIQYQKRAHLTAGNAPLFPFFPSTVSTPPLAVPSAGFPLSRSNCANASIAFNPPCVKLMTRTF